MKKSYSLLSLALVTALSACGAGGGAGSGGNVNPESYSPVDGTDKAALSNAGVTAGVQKNYSNAMTYSGAQYGGDTQGHITFNFGGTQDSGKPDTRTYAQSEWDRNGGLAGAETFTMNEATATDKGHSVAIEKVNVGQEQMTKASLNTEVAGATSFAPTHVVYVPATGSTKTYGGMDAYVGGEGGGAVGVFGDESSQATVATQAGTATYSGPSEGYAMLHHDGFVRPMTGTAAATVDFDTSTYSATAKLHSYDNSTSTTVDMSGSVTSNGLSGSAITVDGTSVNGGSQGTFYGPNADSLGLVYNGVSSDATNNNVGTTHVIGGAIMNKN